MLYVLRRFHLTVLDTGNRCYRFGFRDILSAYRKSVLIHLYHKKGELATECVECTSTNPYESFLLLRGLGTDTNNLALGSFEDVVPCSVVCSCTSELNEQLNLSKHRGNRRLLWCNQENLRMCQSVQWFIPMFQSPEVG
jgi:hypothetical protein